MKKLLSLLFLLSASMTFGQVIQSRIVSVEKGKNQKFQAGVEKKTKMYNAKEGQLRFFPSILFRVLILENILEFDTKTR
jgi:hypothetical protein